MPRRFNLAEAQRLIPRVEGLLSQAVFLKTEYMEAEQEIQSNAQRVSMMGGMVVDREHAIEVKTRRDELAAKLRAAIEGVEDCGCQIKDLDIGLIDFLTLLRGVEVCLCWKLGESKIEFWHGMEDGFRGRKAIDQDFLDNHQGDSGRSSGGEDRQN